MKTIINANTFNGSPIECNIELNVLRLSFSDRYANEMSPLSKQVYSQVSHLVLNDLNKSFKELELSKLSFVIVSKDLEQITLLKITPDADSLSSALYDALLGFIATELGYKAGSKEKPLTFIRKNKDEFISTFFEERIQEISHHSLKRAYELFRNRDYIEALRLAIENYGSLNNAYDVQEADYLIFRIKLKSQNVDDDTLEADFNAKIKELSDRPDLAKRYYFAYIRYWEDKRDFKKPRRLIQAFANKYPTSLLSKEERVIYHHLSGRAEYQRGDFLAALKRFAKAMKALDASDEESYAKILNSSVNCFTDNLFFEEAEALVNKAKEIRERLKLPESFETISCLAGVKAKSTKYEEAYHILNSIVPELEKYQFTPSDENRFNNYLAKNAIDLELYTEAENHLNKAESFGDAKGFSKKLRLYSMFKQNDFIAMQEYFDEHFILPERRSGKHAYDLFVLGWAYAIVAEAAFIQEEYQHGVLYLSDALSFFLQDKYILEARYIALLPYQYDLPLDMLNVFLQNCEDQELYESFDEYVDKHSGIADSYFHILSPNDARIPEKARLQNLADAIDAIDYESKDKSQFEKIRQSINLM